MGRTRLAVIVAISLLVLTGLVIAEVGVPGPDPRPLALIGALIRTETDAGDFVGTIVIQNGKITALGPNAAIPADARRLELANHVITPGLIDAHGSLWLNSAAAREGGREATLNILDAVDPFADDWREVASQGVTAVYVQPNSSGSLGGNGAVLRVGPAGSAEETVLKSPAGVQATLGAAAAGAAPVANVPAGLAGRFGRFNAPAPEVEQAPTGSNTLTRYTQYESLRGQLDGAKKYGDSKPARPDAAKALLLRAVQRDIPLRLETHFEDDIRNALRLTQDFGVRLVFERLDRVRHLPEELTAAKSSMIVGPLHGGKKSADVKRLALDGRRWAIGTYGDDPRASAWLRAHAAAAVADGYPREKVLQALTRDAAELTGVADKMGSLIVGRAADLVVFAGDPLDPAVPVRLTICQGTVTYDNPAAEVAQTGAPTSPNLPERLPASYVIKTKRLQNQNGDFAPGELYIDNGKIAERRSASMSVPTFDVGDAAVTPGLVAGAVTMSDERLPDADAGHLRGADSLMSDDAKLHGLRDSGFLTAIVAPGSKNVIAGWASAARAAEARAFSDVGMKFVLSAAARDNERYPASLVGQVELINNRLRGMPSQSDLYLPPQVRTAMIDQREQNLAAVRSGKATAYFETQTATEARAALRLMAQHRLRGVLLQPKQLDDMLELVREAGVGVVIGPMSVHDAAKSRNQLIALGKAGVPLAFGGGDAAELRATAAWLVNAGLPRSVARRALTAQAPERFGLPAGCGRLNAGDAADFVIWETDPVDTSRGPAAVVSQGQRVGRGS